jgi:hypothetical protein
MVRCYSSRPELAKSFQGARIFVTVNVTTQWGESKVMVSNGAVLDGTSPSFQFARARTINALGKHTTYLNFTEHFLLEWEGIEDHQSGIMKYVIELVSETGSAFSAEVQSSTRLKLDANVLPPGQILVRIHATNRAGLVHEEDLANFTIDATPPYSSDHSVAHKPFPFEVEGCKKPSNTAHIKFAWQDCQDNESPIIGYWYSIIESHMQAFPLQWTSVGLANVAMATGVTLRQNSTYSILLRCENAARLATIIRSSDIFVTNAAPEILSFEHISTYLSSPDNVTAVGEASISHGFLVSAQCGFGLSWVLARADSAQSKRNAQLVKFSTTHYRVSCTIDGAKLENGRKYFFSLKVFELFWMIYSIICAEIATESLPVSTAPGVFVLRIARVAPNKWFHRRFETTAY